MVMLYIILACDSGANSTYGCVKGESREVVSLLEYNDYCNFILYLVLDMCA